ncbi:GNAT family N-acetyltransferase [Luteimonas fraxinea]|uniref:GNAT family N-acetyltransferase n=1 Tax=Luteimonas fraxinea TaxID=2901869 RepID=A0ABS8UDF6_9GAMM|nr:GNAT family N-acetyltransferase [Luteimonas fraxinea]MCD9096693.1 GNAT family N-acetyltransferase [Luteimonas fraxinea]MCD9126062.1 GNAT family N-acetyltransferase [Luteimonas fraxinea]
MPSLTDPTPAMQSFQDVLRQGLPVERGRVDPNVGFYMDTDPRHAHSRFVYVYRDGLTVKAYACFVPYERQEGSPVFAVGYAVPDAYRGHGLAKAVFAAGIAELRNGFSGHPPFFVEAIIDTSNVASQHVAAAVLQISPQSITDQVSGLPALQYLRKFETGLTK